VRNPPPSTKNEGTCGLETSTIMDSHEFERVFLNLGRILEIYVGIIIGAVLGSLVG